MHLLAIDFGIKNLGIALGDTDLGIAFPKDILDNNNEAFSEIQKIVEFEKVGRILVGLPILPSGRETEETENARIFAEHLEDYLLNNGNNIPVDFIDERYSSKTAKISGKGSGLTEKKMRGKIDSAAAAVFLQQYLDRF